MKTSDSTRHSEVQEVLWVVLGGRGYFAWLGTIALVLFIVDLARLGPFGHVALAEAVAAAPAVLLGFIFTRLSRGASVRDSVPLSQPAVGLAMFAVAAVMELVPADWRWVVVAYLVTTGGLHFGGSVARSLGQKCPEFEPTRR